MDAPLVCVAEGNVEATEDERIVDVTNYLSAAMEVSLDTILAEFKRLMANFNFIVKNRYK